MIPTLILILPTSFTARYLFKVTAMYILTSTTSISKQQSESKQFPPEQMILHLHKEAKIQIRSSVEKKYQR